MTTTQKTGGTVWVDATRITPLDPYGNLVSGSNVFVTATPIKVTLTPVVETGDDIAVKNAAGDLSVYAKHGDMVKYGTVSIELALADPYLEQVLAGGVVLNDTTAALGAPSGWTVTGQTTLGTIPAGVSAYRVTQGNQYGESLAAAEIQVTNTGTTSTNVISGGTFASGALYACLYGRTPGGEQKIATLWNIGTQATSAASGTTPSSLTVTALTKPIPSGFTFTIAGDTNSPKIVFTTTAEAGVGAVALPVSTSSTPITTIAAGNIVPCFVDNGSITPSGIVPSVDLSAGPGNNIGYQAPALGSVANTSGVSLELFSKRIINGVQASDYPYWRTVIPAAKNFHIMPRDYTNANLQTILEGQAFQNPNWGSGPQGDFPYDSTKWFQRVMCGAQILPTVSVAPGASLY